MRASASCCWPALESSETPDVSTTPLAPRAGCVAVPDAGETLAAIAMSAVAIVAPK